MDRNIKNYNKRVKKVTNHYTATDKLCMLMEECGELIQASNKFRRACAKKKDKIQKTDLSKKRAYIKLLEEIADVYFMLDQIVIKFNISQKDIDKVVEYKLKRQEKRMSKGM